MTVPLLEIHGAGRFYGKREALKPTTFNLEPGQITALVGPNGSGKTTLLKMVAGLLRPSSGKVFIKGLEPYRERERVMAHASFSFAPAGLYDGMTAWQHLWHLSRLGRKISAKRVFLEDCLRQVGLANRAHEPVSGFSFGMRQRLSLALALAPSPELLVLDEPNEGLDPLAVIELRRLLASLRDHRGMAILLSTHLLNKVDLLADRLVVLQEGQTLFCGPPEALKAGKECLVLQVRQGVDRAAEVFRAKGLNVRITGPENLTLPADCLHLDQAARWLEEASLQLTSFCKQAPDLEEALLEKLNETAQAETS